MATTRINGIRMDLTKMTEHELNALLDMAAGRIATAQTDIGKVLQEQNRRQYQQLALNEG